MGMFYLAHFGDLSGTRIPELVVDHCISGESYQQPLIRTIRTIPTEDIPRCEALVSYLLETLRSEDLSARSTEARGELMIRLATDIPRIVRSAINDEFTSALDDDDIAHTDEEYDLYRVLATLAESGPIEIEPFEDAIENTISEAGENNGRYGNANELPPLWIRAPALQESAATAAGLAGSAAYVTALETFPAAQGRPILHPETTARFLLRCTDETRDGALDTITANFSESNLTTTSTALAKLEPDSTAEAKARLACLERMLVVTSKESPTRSAIIPVLEALDAEAPSLRAKAIKTGTVLMRRRVLLPDEWFSHLLGQVQDRSEAVHEALGDTIPVTVRHSKLSVETVLDILETHAVASEELLAGRRCATTVIGACGVQMPQCRRHAVHICQSLLEADDHTVQFRALKSLASFAELSPNLVEDHIDSLREYSVSGPREARLVREIHAVVGRA